MLNIIVALKCEAKPLIAHYNLKSVPGKLPFPVYERDDITLTLSGPGRVASGAATAFIHTFLEQPANSGWLNLGIAGHKNKSLGQGVLVHKITDDNTGKNWYPTIVFTAQCASENLMTVDQAVEQYRENTLYEMEAAGFYDIASRFSSAELIHCYKIISDNEMNSVTNITEKSILELITANLSGIDSVIQEIRTISAMLNSIEAVSPYYDDINHQWHFSVYQKGELRRLLRRWELVSSDFNENEVDLIPLLKRCKNSKGVLTLLKEKVKQKVQLKTGMQSNL